MQLWKSKRSEPALPFLAMLEHIVVPTFALDADGRVVFWNDACGSLTGISAREVMGTRNHWRGFYRAQRPCLADLALQGTPAQASSLYVQSANADSTGRMTAQNWCDLPARGRRYLRIDAGQIKNASGKVILVVETLQDMTEIKDAEAAMLAEREKVAQQQTLVVKSLASGLSGLASGDLINSLEQPFSAEYETLRRDFNLALAKLRETIVSFGVNAGGVREGAASVMTAADDLAQRTAHQEGALRQTSSALEVLSATVRQTSAHAQRAREVAGTARGDAERSAPVVRKAVEAMGEIEQSSRQIG
ncbi:MAG TPA: PAS domain-containing protein, partial [Acidisoma sp.]|nr:PAS domain-containing protein [Acidisoma sp.]